jgi:hypothetical protein
MWFSLALGFHINIGILCIIDVFIVVYYALMDVNVNVYDTLIN